MPCTLTTDDRINRLQEMIDEDGTSPLVTAYLDMLLTDDPDDLSTDDRKRLALLEYLREWENDYRVGPNDITDHRGERFEYGRCEWLVLDDGEADAMWDEYLDSYLDDCVLPEVPEHARRYFDEDAWKRDARMDGRGHCLSSYDGSEYESREFYIYRTN